MTGTISTVLAAALVTLGSVAVAWIAARQNRRGAATTNALDARKVDLDEFREVQSRNEAALDRADKAANRMEERLLTLERALVTEKSSRENAEERTVTAERIILRLERRIEQLEKVLADHDMPCPTPLRDWE